MDDFHVRIVCVGVMRSKNSFNVYALSGFRLNLCWRKRRSWATCTSWSKSTRSLLLQKILLSIWLVPSCLKVIHCI